MYSKILHPLKAIPLAALLFFMIISCRQSNGGSTNKTPTAATNSTSNIINKVQNGVAYPRDTAPSMATNEPPPPSPPSSSATPYPMTYSDTLAAKGIAMSMKAYRISGVKATVVNGIVTLTGKASKKDLRTILIIANQYRPKKVINKLIVK